MNRPLTIPTHRRPTPPAAFRDHSWEAAGDNEFCAPLGAGARVKR